MPTYEYICRACGREFEQFQSITAPAVRKCPRCGKPRVERKISLGGGVLFKGGGFYETDYRSAAFKDDAKKEAESAKPKTESDSTAKKPDQPAKQTESSAAEKPTADKPAADKPKPTEPPTQTPSKNKTHARAGRGAGNLRHLGQQAHSKTRKTKGSR